MASAHTASGYLLAHMATVLRTLDREPEPLFGELSLSEVDVAQADARVAFDVACAFFERAHQCSGDPTFGLTCAAHLGEGYPALRYALRNSRTLGEAYGRWSRFYGLITDYAAQSLQVEGGRAVLRCVARAQTPLPTVLEDWMVGQWLTLGRHLCGTDWTPVAVQLQHSDAERAAAYEGWFGAPVCFGGDASELSFDTAVLDLGIRGADVSLSILLDRHIEGVLSRLPSVSSFTDRVRARIARELDGGDPSASAVARSLHMSERTLLRRLRDEGTTPRDLLNELRCDLAQRYLADPGISILEVAFLLGYADAAPFHRAFKRWTGETPAGFRSRRTK